ncbi:glycine--tRNA ligase, partial [Candidatus Woesearchaeota archaeon]|nr:glycine--tRNA ligase [Candidatus Woesearchaeota archaeon]
YDLKQHAKHSKKELGVSDETHKKEVPHVLEIAFGTDRMTFVLLDLLFNPQEMSEGKTTFHIPYHIAPIKAAIYPLVKKEGMPEIAKEIYDDLSKDFVCVYDQAGSIGRRYLRAAEQGIPYCITIDGDSIKNKTVTLRDRDTEKQVVIKIDELKETLRKKF